MSLSKAGGLESFAASASGRFGALWAAVEELREAGTVGIRERLRQTGQPLADHRFDALGIQPVFDLLQPWGSAQAAIPLSSGSKAMPALRSWHFVCFWPFRHARAV